MLNKYIFVGFLLLAFVSFTKVHSQCSQKIEFTKLPSSDQDESKGHIKVSVSCAEPFNVKLSLIDGTQEVPVKSLSGSGSQTFSFDLLEKQYLYRIVVEFKNEAKFLCRRKQKIIDLNESNL